MRLDPRTTALLVIDLQNDTVGEGGAEAFAKEHCVVERAAQLAEASDRSPSLKCGFPLGDESRF